MWNVVWIGVLFGAGALVYGFRKPILSRLSAFDARHAARRAEEIQVRRDRFAHYRHAVLTAEDSLEEVRSVTISDERTGQPLKRFMFLGEIYLTRNDAETARRARAIQIAREFYAELDGATLPRRPDPEPPAPPAALPDPEILTPPRPS
jgi:hypothetical protein